MISATWLAWYIAVTFGLMALAWYPCCCGGGETDDWCTLCLSPEYEYPDTLSVTLAGVGDGVLSDGGGGWLDCDCSDRNATWVLLPLELSACEWNDGMAFTCYTLNTYTNVNLYVEISGGVTRIRVYCSGTGSATWTHTFGTSDPIDCSATYNFGGANPDSYTNNTCEWDAATCQVN